jgi:hypothetical protein
MAKLRTCAAKKAAPGVADRRRAPTSVISRELRPGGSPDVSPIDITRADRRRERPRVHIGGKSDLAEHEVHHSARQTGSQVTGGSQCRKLLVNPSARSRSWSPRRQVVNRKG